MMEKNTSLTRKIKKKAIELGFDACGISKVEKLEEQQILLNNWIQEERNANMTYMERNSEKRADPGKLVEGAKSVISVLLNYYTDNKQEDKNAPKVSKFAYRMDYHFVLKEKLKKLHLFINTELGEEISGRAFVDSAPVFDKIWALKSGLGFIGKNSLLINKKIGSFTFIGELILNLELKNDEEIQKDSCGTCTRCIDSCPTNAILPNKTIDARRCISYITTDLKGSANKDLQKKLKNHVFGCDICQDVCPFNKKAINFKEEKLKPKKEILEMTKQDWVDITKEEFKKRFKKTPIERIGYKRLMKNLDYLSDV